MIIFMEKSHFWVTNATQGAQHFPDWKPLAPKFTWLVGDCDQTWFEVGYIVDALK